MEKTQLAKKIRVNPHGTNEQQEGSRGILGKLISFAAWWSLIISNIFYMKNIRVNILLSAILLSLLIEGAGSPFQS